MTDKYWCEKCDLKEHTFRSRMSTCPECGSKRCPRAKDHLNACTGTAVKESLTPHPAWRDAPTQPGLWLNRINGETRQISAANIGSGAWRNTGARFYGPIPEDKP